ncbi:MAG TPA: hypothetical protein VF246_05305 [Acidimicrobiia bacterium]
MAKQDTDRDSLEILRHLHSKAVERFHARRSLEWQFAFTFWTLLGALGVSADGLPTSVRAYVVEALAILAVVFHATLQQRYIRRQMQRDWGLGKEIDTYLRSRLGTHVLQAIPILAPDNNLTNPYSTWWSHSWQVAVTGLVGAIAFLSAL